MQNRHHVGAIIVGVLGAACYGGGEPTTTAEQAITWTTEVYVVDGVVTEQKLYEISNGTVISKRTFDSKLNLVSETHEETTAVVSDLCHGISYPFYSASLQAWDQSNKTGNTLCVIAKGGNPGDSACLDLTTALRYYHNAHDFGYWVFYVRSASSGAQNGAFWEGTNDPTNDYYGAGCAGTLIGNPNAFHFGTHEDICSSCSVQPDSRMTGADSLTLYQ